MNLAGNWEFCLDKEKKGLELNYFNMELEDTIVLPTTTSEAKKGEENSQRETGYLTDPYFFEGYAWYSKKIQISEKTEKQYTFIMERTRISHVWIDGKKVGSKDSLCASHKYLVTEFLSPGEHRLTVMIDNTSYKTRGGHMTSPDTQTNWNGILGEITLKETGRVAIEKVTVTPSKNDQDAFVFVELNNKYAKQCEIHISGVCRRLSNEDSLLEKSSIPQYHLVKATGTSEIQVALEETKQKNTISFEYSLGNQIFLWDEYEPNVYAIKIQVLVDGKISDQVETEFGLRDFTHIGLDLKCNDRTIFLRGKHDGLIFPLTGYAPMEVADWLKVLKTAKSYGINHYRFHTCCPPKAAFVAADYLGIYMEPELPFWGTIAEEGDEYYNGPEREYLVEEGFRILEEFGNSPSFFAFSMGNELWGSKEAINDIMGKFKKKDQRHLYTQGSNNHQFVPSVLENDDFFSGVRFSKYRLFRGSYAMCDAPLGHVQMDMPNTLVHYDDMILPKTIQGENGAQIGDTIQIQYGTGVKEVKVEEGEAVIIPTVPVVSHEIGQYETSPNFDEIEKYTGVLKARNFEVFKERLQEAGLFSYWKDYFMASGRLAGECYQRELESAMNSKYLSGFQILDLQDFSGQGTALVGILDAFLDNKGTVSREEWTSYCSDAVLLPCFEKFVYTCGETFKSQIKLRYYNPKIIAAGKIRALLSQCKDGKILEEKVFDFQEINGTGLFELGSIEFKIPEIEAPEKYHVAFEILGESIKKEYDIWVYPALKVSDIVLKYAMKDPELVIATAEETAKIGLLQGKKVLYFPQNQDKETSIEGTYATDFWCYPMFRSISESVNRAIPVGTLGLLIDDKHPALKEFPTEFHTTPQWFHIVNASRSTILKDSRMNPIVRTIDNFERNHNLGLLYELQIATGKLLVCTANLPELEDKIEAVWLMKSLLEYITSEDFQPKDYELEDFSELFTTK